MIHESVVKKFLISMMQFLSIKVMAVSRPQKLNPSTSSGFLFKNK